MTKKTITFSSDRVYEVTGIWVKEGRMQDLNDYFNEVFPIALEGYGVRPLFSLQPLSTHAGDFRPQVMFVNEWPSIEHFNNFVNDPQALKLFPRRDAAVSRLVVSHYTVPETVSIDLAEGDVLEFAAMWIKPGKEGELQEYYQTVFPVALNHGLKPVTPLSPVSSYRGDFMPSRAALNLWGEKSRFDAFAQEVREQFPKRDAALERLEVTHAAVRFEGSK